MTLRDYWQKYGWEALTIIGAVVLFLILLAKIVLSATN